MKKLLLSLILLIATTKGYSQTKYSFDNYGWSNILYHANPSKPNFSHIDSFAITHKIYQINKNIVYYSKKGKADFSKEIINYDTKGRSYLRLRYSDTGLKQAINLMANRNYDEKGLLESSYYRNHFFSRTEFYQYNDSNKIIKSSYFNHKNKYSGQTNIAYNALGKESNVSYFNHKQHLGRAYEYYYHGNGQLKQTVLKDKKGKVKQVTDYTCDDIGKKVQKLKDTAKICSIKSYLPNGHVVTTTNGFNYNGKPYKTVDIQDSMHQLLKYEVYIGIKEEFQYGTTYTYTNGRLTKTELRNHYNPKKPYQRIMEYDQNGRITKDESTYQISKSKQNIWKNTFTYNANGLLTQEQSFKNGKLYSETTFSYNYYQ